MEVLDPALAAPEAEVVGDLTPASPTAPAEQAAEEYDPASFYDDDQPADQDEEEQEAPAEEELEPEPIEAPLSWAKDAKDIFAKIPREAQEIIATRERDREASVQAKFREAAGTRQQVETEARQALQTIMTNHQQALAQYEAQFQVPEPDERLLYTGDLQHELLYKQQEAAYRRASAQREHLTQQMTEARQHAEAVQLHQQQAELQAEHVMLEQTLGTEWSDPSSRAKLLSTLQPIAAELGYPPELIAQARGVDIIAMKRVADKVSALQAKADKYDELQKRKMIPVRAARGIPPIARTAAPQGQRQPISVEAQLYPDEVRRN